MNILQTLSKPVWAPDDSIAGSAGDDTIASDGEDTTTGGDETTAGGEDTQPKDLLADDTVQAAQETSEPIDREAIIKGLGDDVVIQDEAKLGEFFDLIDNIKDRGEFATSVLKMAGEVRDSTLESVAEDFQKTVTDWQEETRKDPVYGGQNLDKSTATAKQIAKEIGGPEFLEFLMTTGVSNNVRIIGFLNKVADALPKEAKPVLGSPAETGTKSLADRIFG